MPRYKKRDFLRAANLSVGLFFTASVAWLSSYLWGLLVIFVNYWEAGNPITLNMLGVFLYGLSIFPIMIVIFALYLMRLIRRNPALAKMWFGPEVTEVSK
jgi:hypothetical protein